MVGVEEKKIAETPWRPTPDHVRGILFLPPCRQLSCKWISRSYSHAILYICKALSQVSLNHFYISPWSRGYWIFTRSFTTCDWMPVVCEWKRECIALSCAIRISLGRELTFMRWWHQSKVSIMGTTGFSAFVHSSFWPGLGTYLYIQSPSIRYLEAKEVIRGETISPQKWSILQHHENVTGSPLNKSLHKVSSIQSKSLQSIKF